MVDIAVILGSDSDYDVMSNCFKVLDDFGVSYDAHVLSCHRVPDQVTDFAKSAFEKGYKVIIAGAGGSAALGGAIAAHTTLPVVGVPIPTANLGGVDSLYSTVQMPPGVPVAAVAIGTWGSHNAALFACQIIGTSDESMRQKLADYKRKVAEGVAVKNDRLQAKLKGEG